VCQGLFLASRRVRQIGVSAEFIGRRLDGLQNNLSGLNRRMVTLESNLIDRVGMPEARMAGLEDRADQLVDRISALETSVDLPSMKLDTGVVCGRKMGVARCLPERKIHIVHQHSRSARPTANAGNT
jgi:hypothetical protein